MDNHFYDDDDDDIGGGNKKLRAKRVKQGPDLVEIETLESQAFLPGPRVHCMPCTRQRSCSIFSNVMTVIKCHGLGEKVQLPKSNLNLVVYLLIGIFEPLWLPLLLGSMYIWSLLNQLNRS